MRVPSMSSFCFITQLTFIFFNDTATTEIYTLSLHDALPIFERADEILVGGAMCFPFFKAQGHSVGASLCEDEGIEDRKSTRLNSSHANISYAVFCLQKIICRRLLDDALRSLRTPVRT